MNESVVSLTVDIQSRVLLASRPSIAESLRHSRLAVVPLSEGCAVSIDRVLRPAVVLAIAALAAACSPGAASLAPSVAPAPESEAPASTAPASQEASAPVVLRLSHDQPIEHPNTANIELFASEVARLSNGSVTIEIYPAAQLYAEEDILAALQRGEVDMGQVPDWATVEPAVLIADLPFEFSSWEEFHAALDGEVGKLLTDSYESKGIKTLYFQDNTTIDLIGTNVKLVKVPADIAGLRMRSFSEAASEAITEWGASPTQISGAETYTAVQRGTVDGIISGVSFFERKWYEVTPFITQIPVSFRTNPIQMNLDKWDSLGADQQAAITEGAAIALADNREQTPLTNVDSYGQMRDTLAEEFYVATPEEIELWKAATTGTHAWYLEQGGDLAQAILDARAGD
jgi:TRAP-type C4-dicarboxylate transport system substrate-binding protein